MKKAIFRLLLLPVIAAAEPSVYRNPIIKDGADPGLVRKDGLTYIFVTSHMNTVMLKSPNGATDWSEPKIVYQGGNNTQGWAPSLREQDDTWHLYTAGTYSTGTSLEGPFTFQKKALGFDPYYYHDTEGTGKHYLIWGGSHTGNCIAEMETPSKLKPDTGLYFLPPTGWGGTWEGLWLEKINGSYVLMISANGANSPEYRLHYATADSIDGPYTFQSDLHDAAFLRRSDYEGIYGPGHHAMLQDEHGTWWVYYQQHNDGGGHWNRSIAIDPLWFDAAGHPNIRPTRGIDRPAPGSPPSVIWPAIPATTPIEAEAYHGSRCNQLMDGNGGTVVGDFRHAGWISFRNVDFQAGLAGFSVTAANGNTSPTSLELRLDSAQGEVIGGLLIPPAGDWETYQSQTVKLLRTVSGTHDLFLVANGAQAETEAVRIDHFQFLPDAETPSIRPTPLAPQSTTLTAGGTVEIDLLNEQPGLQLVSAGGIQSALRSEKANSTNLTIDQNGNLTYRAPGSYWGTDRVVYTVKNQQGAYSRGVLTLRIEPEHTAHVVDGTAVIQGEDFAGHYDYKDTLQWGTGSAIPGFTGTGYVQTPNQGTKQWIAERAGNPRSAELDYPIQIPEAGIYHVWARVYAPDAESNNASISLSTSSDVRTRPDINQAWLIEPKTTGQWEWVKIDNPLSIPAGLHRLALRRGQDGLAVDQIVMTRFENFNPEDAALNRTD